MLRAFTEFSLPGLYVTEPADLPFMKGVQVRSYLIRTDKGVVAIYNSPGLSQDRTAIADLGTPSAILMSHWHEAMYRRQLDAPTYVSAADFSQTKASIPDVRNLADYHGSGDGIEIVPTPGHTAGFSIFVWTCGERRVLFSGDMIWPHDGRWEAVVLGESDRQKYIASLETIAELDFDVLIPWVANSEEAYVVLNDKRLSRPKLLEIARRIKNGEDV